MADEKDYGGKGYPDELTRRRQEVTIKEYFDSRIGDLRKDLDFRFQALRDTIVAFKN